MRYDAITALKDVKSRKEGTKFVVTVILYQW